MEIPDWVRWIFLGLVLLHLLSLVTVVRRVRRADAVGRRAARIDVVDVVGSLLMAIGIGLGVVSLAAVGFVIMVGAMTVGLVRRVRVGRAG